MYTEVANPHNFTPNCCTNYNHLSDPEFGSKLCSRHCRIGEHIFADVQTLRIDFNDEISWKKVTACFRFVKSGRSFAETQKTRLFSFL